MRPVVERGIGPAHADGRVDVEHRRILADDLGDLALALGHRVERNVRLRLGDRQHEAGVFLREEALRNGDIEPDRADDGRECHHQHDRLVGQHPVERPFVALEPELEGAFEHAQDPHLLLLLFALVMAAQHARAQHRRQRQRDEAGQHDGDRNRHREFAEHAADDAAHQQHRDEHRDQRECDRHDGEADFARTLERRLERPHAALDMADDVFQHDDGVVDHEADRQCQRQQRHVVDRKIEGVHRRASADQRNRHREGRE